ncbi:putative ribosome biogenesis GTPase RsgA [Anaerocolumna cellulosilytica]|uniref:Small ribosomal subunit biogenesis GTPase RsgA n=1 Tax=Anaerocolumna cellulosilytica TaxID=433286 RepID=A0A6S6R707_9FIRM|nr:ribosome small subunit-dependent GTPase A [Anaerocolumna cellulosilytica]MBB5197067.1 ribosome biogenesis GTPase [Anaerocolumna cellulosilytica]BCJ95280.1 putative ribosome biogenesis GTPase RsgA [Anaerocolumna cellulosilytica]
MTGKIIKGIAGFYYVYVEQHGLYECKAKGIFRNQKVKPLVGDNVSIDVLDEEGNKGNITAILPRNNALIRPAVANVDQAVVIFAAADPAPNLNLLDRFLVLMLKQRVETIICFNKRDIVTEDDILLLEAIYKKCGYHVIFTSTYTEEGLLKLKELLKDKTSVVAGPSGVGKSSIVNHIQPEADMETGEISDKIKRGKHTTRHSEIIYIQKGTYICDTPGFSSLYVNDMEKEELKNYFMEFRDYEDACRFQGCVHINEPGCAVKNAVKSGKISEIRYENYSVLYEELKNIKKY